MELNHFVRYLLAAAVLLGLAACDSDNSEELPPLGTEVTVSAGTVMGNPIDILPHLKRVS